MTIMVNNPALADSLESLADTYENAANIARAQADALRHGFAVNVDITLTTSAPVMGSAPTPSGPPMTHVQPTPHGVHNHAFGQEPTEPCSACDGPPAPAQENPGSYMNVNAAPVKDPFAFMTAGEPKTPTDSGDDDDDFEDVL
jgi:hypothetical protein